MKEELRITNQTVMNKISKIVPNFIGGSADLGSSTMAVLSDSNNVVSNNYNGKNIYFGVREHAMGAILNGLSLSKFKNAEDDDELDLYSTRYNEEEEN